MEYRFMYGNIFLLLLFILINTQPIFAQAKPPQIKTNLAYYSEEFLGVKNGHRYSNKGTIKFDLKNSSSQLSLNYNNDVNYTFDGSYLQFTKGIATFGVGKVDRNWSFSDETSLILSNNTRPSTSVYLKLKNSFRHNWFPSKANWSFEGFNGFTEGSLDGKKSMLLGMRAILSPVEGLEFELVKTSQWGGKSHGTGLSALGAALLTDTNTNSNSNINKMAGFGISYTVPARIMPLRVYGQTVAEDEAGNLPSCFAYLIGLELENIKIKYPTIIGIEVVDTRIDSTTNGYCGPNTMYNNSIYSYTNYGKSMGVDIDTEGTSLTLYLRSQVSQKIDIEFTTKSVVINDNNWSGHRLSSNRQLGLTSSLGVSWNKDNINFNANIYNQALNLDKTNIKSGYGVGFSSSIIF